jgi:hypothetical protein
MRAELICPLLVIAILSVVSPANGCEIKCATDTSTAHANEEDYKPLKMISIFALLADPEKYHEQRIGVVGVFRLYFDRMSLYATQEHFAADEFGSSLWVELPQCVRSESIDEMSEWQGKFVRIDGVFNAKLRNFAAGTLQDVELAKLWYTAVEQNKQEIRGHPR